MLHFGLNCCGIAVSTCTGQEAQLSQLDLPSVGWTWQNAPVGLLIFASFRAFSASPPQR